MRKHSWQQLNRLNGVAQELRTPRAPLTCECRKHAIGKQTSKSWNVTTSTMNMFIPKGFRHG